jgi:PAS domain S-box-containing protein
MARKPNIPADVPALRRRAEARLRERRRNHRSTDTSQRSEADPQRLVHELQVHKIELEMQNAELQGARDKTEALLEKYTDLYDFAPVGYFSLDEQGLIMEGNLTGAVLLGVERSRLINRRLLGFVAPASQPVFLAFLKEIFARSGKQVCEATVLKEDGPAFWADFQAISAVSFSGSRKWCRVAVSDITALKRAKEAQGRMEALTVTNRELKREIVRRQAVEAALKHSEQHTSRLLEQSRRQQEQLRLLTHQMLSALEEERKQISRELHDEIVQTLTGINVHLATLEMEAAHNTTGLTKKIARTQRLVEKSVNIVHRFARDLRPTMLDDLGLIPTLHSHLKDFTKRTGIHIHLTTFSLTKFAPLDSAKRTVLYRVAQAALTNIALHAQASRVAVNIRKVPGAIRMEIKDDGKGFEVESLLRATRRQRLGLLGMKERVQMVGGSFGVESAPGRGTTICAQIPFGNAGRRGGISGPVDDLTLPPLPSDAAGLAGAGRRARLGAARPAALERRSPARTFSVRSPVLKGGCC